MSDYQMIINGNLSKRDLKCVDKYLGMVNYDDSLLITLEDYNERDSKIICELCISNNITVNKKESSISGKYIIKGIKEKHCYD